MSAPMPASCLECGCTLKTALDAQLHRCIVLPRVPREDYGQRRARRPIVSSKVKPRTPFWRRL